MPNNRRKISNRFLAVAVVCVAALGLLEVPWSAAFAVLPPSVFEKMQRESPESLEIEVLQVTAPDPGKREIHAAALVVHVHRSASGLRSGDLIHVVYAPGDLTEKRPGSGIIPPLEEGQKTVAYLAKIPGTEDFAPAAGAMSFSNF